MSRSCIAGLTAALTCSLMPFGRSLAADQTGAAESVRALSTACLQHVLSSEPAASTALKAGLTKRLIINLPGVSPNPDDQYSGPYSGLGAVHIGSGYCSFHIWGDEFRLFTGAVDQVLKNQTRTWRRVYPNRIVDPGQSYYCDESGDFSLSTFEADPRRSRLFHKPAFEVSIDYSPLFCASAKAAPAS